MATVIYPFKLWWLYALSLLLVGVQGSIVTTNSTSKNPFTPFIEAKMAQGLSKAQAQELVAGTLDISVQALAKEPIAQLINSDGRSLRENSKVFKKSLQLQKSIELLTITSVINGTNKQAIIAAMAQLIDGQAKSVSVLVNKITTIALPQSIKSISTSMVSAILNSRIKSNQPLRQQIDKLSYDIDHIILVVQEAMAQAKQRFHSEGNPLSLQDVFTQTLQTKEQQITQLSDSIRTMGNPPPAYTPTVTNPAPATMSATVLPLIESIVVKDFIGTYQIGTTIELLFNKAVAFQNGYNGLIGDKIAIHRSSGNEAKMGSSLISHHQPNGIGLSSKLIITVGTGANIATSDSLTITSTDIVDSDGQHPSDNLTITLPIPADQPPIATIQTTYTQPSGNGHTITVTFNEPIDTNTTSQTVTELISRLSVDGRDDKATTTPSLIAKSLSWSADQQTLTITLPDDTTLTKDNYIYIAFMAGVVNDRAGNRLFNEIITQPITIQPPEITQATYNSHSGVLLINGDKLPTNIAEWDFTKLSLIGQGGTLTLTAHNTTATHRVQASLASNTQVTITWHGNLKTEANRLLNSNGWQSSDGTVYNVEAKAGFSQTSPTTADEYNNSLLVKGYPPRIKAITIANGSGVVNQIDSEDNITLLFDVSIDRDFSTTTDGIQRDYRIKYTKSTGNFQIYYGTATTGRSKVIALFKGKTSFANHNAVIEATGIWQDENGIAHSKLILTIGHSTVDSDGYMKTVSNPDWGRTGRVGGIRLGAIDSSGIKGVTQNDITPTGNF